MQGPYNRRKRRKLSSEINVVPFIDVMLVLLIIFMITAPMMNQGVDVELPKVSSEPIENQADPVIVSVDKAGQYYINLGDDHEKPIELDEIGDQVVKIVTRNPKTPVMVRGDTNATYGQIVTLMSTLQGAGVPNVGLISDPPSAN
ncbi:MULTISPECIES: protein TolR [Larsenimonas]|uniref:Tol-Pal system protein TolR n=1 Tax=Larsenimonas suaedae TaxID=1851019 RepID=A0ABU1GXQ3_9GAMM|nr:MULTISPECIES: protein TolR [Larsenimonas]MCM2971364.1 protein TolR [Larsenimonas suaedae]MCM5703471.1 protein TolR [Larsenimonas salina]MDR5896620.1 protein TolR [Larsenimonas suaedae]